LQAAFDAMLGEMARMSKVVLPPPQSPVSPDPDRAPYLSLSAPSLLQESGEVAQLRKKVAKQSAQLSLQTKVPVVEEEDSESISNELAAENIRLKEALSALEVEYRASQAGGESIRQQSQRRMEDIVTTVNAEARDRGAEALATSRLALEDCAGEVEELQKDKSSLEILVSGLRRDLREAREDNETILSQEQATILEAKGVLQSELEQARRDIKEAQTRIKTLESTAKIESTGNQKRLEKANQRANQEMQDEVKAILVAAEAASKIEIDRCKAEAKEKTKRQLDKLRMEASQELDRERWGFAEEVLKLETSKDEINSQLRARVVELESRLVECGRIGATREESVALQAAERIHYKATIDTLQSALGEAVRQGEVEARERATRNEAELTEKLAELSRVSDSRERLERREIGYKEALEGVRREVETATALARQLEAENEILKQDAYRTMAMQQAPLLSPLRGASSHSHVSPETPSPPPGGGGGALSSSPMRPIQEGGGDQESMPRYRQGEGGNHSPAPTSGRSANPASTSTATSTATTTTTNSTTRAAMPGPMGHAMIPPPPRGSPISIRLERIRAIASSIREFEPPSAPGEAMPLGGVDVDALMGEAGTLWGGLMGEGACLLDALSLFIPIDEIPTTASCLVSISPESMLANAMQALIQQQQEHDEQTTGVLTGAAIATIPLFRADAESCCSLPTEIVYCCLEASGGRAFAKSLAQGQREQQSKSPADIEVDISNRKSRGISTREEDVALAATRLERRAERSLHSLLSALHKLPRGLERVLRGVSEACPPGRGVEPVMTLLFERLYLPELENEARECIDPSHHHALEAIAHITRRVIAMGAPSPGSPSSWGHPSPVWLDRMGGLVASKSKLFRSACEALVLSWSAQPPPLIDRAAVVSICDLPGWSNPLPRQQAENELALSLGKKIQQIDDAVERQMAARPAASPDWTPVEAALRRVRGVAAAMGKR